MAPPDRDDRPETTDTELSDPAEANFLRAAAHAPAGEPATRLIGQTLGRYRVDSLLGRGGMGVVYFAQDLKLRRPVALKVLPPALVADVERRARFLREARSAAAVTHPGVAAVYDVGEDAGNVFLAMEYVAGRTLRAVVAGRGEGAPALSSAEVARIGHDIAAALAKAHAAGVIHRDLKPENVMISEDGIVKILDFGLAKLRERETSALSQTEGHLTEAGRIMGTPRYMSPEQALGRPVDERTDLFSLGVILYELCSGTPPYRGVTDMEELVARTRDDPRPLRELRPDVSADLARVVERCLKRDPASRAPSAAAVAAELQPIAGPSLGGLVPSGESRLTIPPAALGTRPPRRRWPWLGLGAVLAAGLAAIAWHRGRVTPAISPLAPPEATIACPVFETQDVARGWLGAAAAHIACDRATLISGRLWKHALTPAMLLDLPRQPVDRFPEDPFAAPDARARSVAAARTRGTVTLDGLVVAEDRGFRVRLTLLHGDRALARGEGSGEALWQAVRAALPPVTGPHALPRSARTHSFYASWTGLPAVDVAEAWEDVLAAFTSGVGVPDEMKRIEPRKRDLGDLHALAEWAFAAFDGRTPASTAPPAIDRSSPQAFQRTTSIHLMMGGSTPAKGLADEMAALRAKMTDDLERRNALLGEADLRLRAGENDKARDLVLAALPEEPRLGWNTLTMATHSRTGQVSVARARAAWEPSHPDGWNLLAYAGGQSDPHRKLEFMRRSYAMAPGNPMYPSQLGRMLLIAGEREEARALAARLLSGEPRLQGIGEALAIEIEASEGRFAAALAKVMQALLAQPEFGRPDRPDFMMWPTAVELAMVLGRESEVAQAFVEKFVLPEPPRIARYPQQAEGAVLACALAPRDVAGRCAARMNALIAAGHFQGAFDRTTPFLAGAERYAQRDYSGAVAAWRTLAGEPPSGRTWLVLPDAFDRVGEHYVAERIDKQGPYTGLIRGLSIAHLRMARRAAARGDTARARELAQGIVDAWSVADERVPAVEEMRGLLARLR